MRAIGAAYMGSRGRVAVGGHFQRTTRTDDKRVQSRGAKNGQRRALTTATLSLYFEALTHTAAI